MNSVTITLTDTQEVHLDEENTITAAEVFVAVKTLKTSGFDKILQEVLKQFEEFCG